MSLKIKIITIALSTIIIVTVIVSFFIYVNSLNNKVVSLNKNILDQQKEIQSLNCQIDLLEKKVVSFRETINIANSYIDNLEKTRTNELSIKQEVNSIVNTDSAVKEWYETELPQTLLHTLYKNSDTANLVCD